MNQHAHTIGELATTVAAPLHMWQFIDTHQLVDVSVSTGIEFGIAKITQPDRFFESNEIVNIGTRCPAIAIARVNQRIRQLGGVPFLENIEYSKRH
jgi:hypothetical protein